MIGIDRINLYGAVLANAINVSTIPIFIARLLGKPEVGHWIGLMIVFIIVDFLVDWFPKIDFRDNLLIVIPYVMLFFGAAGGMIGVASLAGKRWAVVTVTPFLIMAVLAFVQRQVTGM